LTTSASTYKEPSVSSKDENVCCGKEIPIIWIVFLTEVGGKEESYIMAVQNETLEV
jgi:hypothetical protein